MRTNGVKQESVLDHQSLLRWTDLQDRASRLVAVARALRTKGHSSTANALGNSQSHLVP